MSRYRNDPERKCLINFNTGDTVHHAIHGIGTIEAFEEKEMMGQKFTFAFLFFERDGLKLMLPEKKLRENVRKPMDKLTAEGVFTQIEELEITLDKNWKIRSKRNRERLDSGNPLEVAEVYKGLAHIKLAKGSLNNSDRRQFDLSRDLLTEELSHALGHSPERTHQLLEACCSKRTNAA